MRSPGPIIAIAALILAAIGEGQTTQGIITGHIRDQLTGRPVADAEVYYESLDSNTHGTHYASTDGNYYIPLLPPGLYHVRANSANDPTSKSESYQAREVYALLVTVAGYVQVDFDLRPLSDVWERGRYRSHVFRNNTVVPFFGPDIDPSYVGDFEPARHTGGQLEPSMSDVIDPKAIASLPLAGRDVYAALVLLPGVTADSTTTRSLGLSANGQRPSSSNFLLDGMEENDSLLSGPAIQLAPEMVQEYRVSTNNFSAEYGRTSGYVANAVTRSARAAWHGIGYGDLNNDVLNANTFAHNLVGVRRTTTHQIEGGVSAGGALPHSRILTWSAYDYFGSRGFSDPESLTLPTQSFAASLPPASLAKQLLQDHPPRQWANDSAGDQGLVQFKVPVTLRRSTALERVDYILKPKQRVMARVGGTELKRPDFNWSAYGEAPLSQQNVGAAVALTSEWSSSLVSEIRASFLSTYRSWDLVLADVPLTAGLGALQLPGYCCQTDSTQEGWKDRNSTTEVFSNFNYGNGPHVLKFGAGLLNSQTETRFKIPPADEFGFVSKAAFEADNPYLFETTLSGIALQKSNYQAPDTNRQYRETQPYAFLQEDWRVTPRLTLNAGLRYDRFPAPVNTGSVPDVVVAPGPGASFDEQIATARLATHSGSLFSARANNWSVRLAFSLALLKSRRTILRGGYGTFYDRPFDNFFLSATANDLSIVDFTGRGCPIDAFYADRQNTNLLSTCPPQASSRTLLDLTMFQPQLRSPRVQSFFLSLQQPLGRNLVVELNGTGARGRNLLATDVVNRQTDTLPPENGLPNLDYRTNGGFSDYTALSFTARYRTGRVTLNSAYTWSHSIDNQSDPLQGEYFDFGFSNQTDRFGELHPGAFSLPGDSRIDRGNSDFDQRQNFVGWTVVALPDAGNRRLKPVLSNWTAAAVFALRSGLPFSVYAGPANCFPICNPRADILDPAHTRLNEPVPGGVRVLNASGFGGPAEGSDGNSGRNAFSGPGFGNLDLSVARTFRIHRLGEQTRLIVRGDAFNLFNHSNLQSPDSNLGGSDFGVSLYGTTAQKNGFPSLTPLADSARQIHLLLRFEF